MELTDGLRTTPAARAFTDAAVSDETLAELLDVARFAPSGGNRQPWRVVVVRDVALRRQLADLCAPVWWEYVALGATGITPFNVGGDAPDAPPEIGPVDNALLDHVETVPVVLVVAADLRQVAMMDNDLDRAPITGGASLYPFVWSLLLAARDRGLGGVMTTFLARAEVEAAPLLGLPAGHALASMVFLGEPTTRPTKLRRNPVETFTTIDRFDGAPFPAGVRAGGDPRS